MKSLKSCLLTVVLLTLAITVWADGEPDLYELGQLVVTAERYPVKEKESCRFVTVATAQQLVESGGNNLIDALKRTGSLSYKSLAPLGVSRMGMKSEVSIRGLEDGELVLINGVPIQSASGGSYDLNAIGLDQVERVEVLSGAASTLYGADAMTGVINIITRQTGQGVSPYARVEVGEEGYQNHSAGFTSAQLNFGVRYQRLDGIDTIYRKFSTRSPYTYDMQGTDQYSASLNYHPVEHLYVDYLFTRIETGFVRRYESPTRSPIFYDQNQDKHFADIRYEADNFKIKGFYSFDELTKEQTSPAKPEEKRRTYNYGLSSDYRFDALSFEHTVGGDVIRRVADYEYSYGRHYRDDSALFWQVKRRLLERLQLSAGAREQFINGADGARDYSRFLPSAGASFRLTSALNLFANAGKAFRAPSFNDLYYKTGTRVGNPDLNPEEGWTYEAGVKYDHRYLRLRVALFLMEFEDKIISYERADGMNSYYNAGDYENKGVEWDAMFYPFNGQDNLLQNITLSARGFVANPVADDENGDEEQVGPRVQTAFGLNYLSDPFTFNLDVINQNDREDDLENELTVNLYSKFKLPVGYATFTVDNLFDEEIVTGGTTSSEYYGLGRMIKVGYEIHY
ncbi:MAG: TonB-dependent receptor [Desulfuromonas sp.]|nr:TonB-dependent receptor [Desulfuromonas sp.]